MAIKSYLVDGKKFYEVYVNGFDNRGRRVQRRKRGVESIKKAEDVEFEFERELARLKEEKVPLRWSEWVAIVIAQIRLELLPSTVINYEAHLTTWVTPKWKDREIREITKQDVYDVVFCKEGCDLSPWSRRTLLKYIKRVFTMAVEQGELDRSPAAGIKVTVPEAHKNVLTRQEVQKLFAEAKICNHRFYPVWVCATMTGMRSGELIALKWTDIDFDSKMLSVTKQWTQKNGLGPTKTKQHRKVPISDELLRFLKSLRLQAGSSEYVLPRLREWEKGSQAQVLRDFCKGIGITPIKFHDLRATFITTLLAQGESLGRVMAIVGHSELRTTNGYYRRSGVELNGGTDRLGLEIPDENEATILQLIK